MRCKKEIMGLAAIMVLFFHFYIPFGTSAIETFIYRSSYIGVDLFFFVSAYSIVSRNKQEKFEAMKFILNRLSLIYLPFVILSIICALYKKWSIIRFFKVIGGVEFYERGGGAFLWYFIGITLVYLLVPLFLLIKNKMKLFGLPILLGIWLVLSLTLQYGLNYQKMFILINRLPVFFIAMYFDDIVLIWFNKLKSIYKFIIGFALFITGIFLVQITGIMRLQKPFADMYYVVAIPLIISIVLLVITITTSLQNKYKSVILKFIGTITLELYGLQMIFGYDIEGALLKIVPSNMRILAFFGTSLALIAMAFVTERIFSISRKHLAKLTNKPNTST